ncbi:hypothetical protein GCM10007939_12350 [Amylibacter marinus]|uniref:DUF952 domain-containing protein n=1 Tax=Amylibacter marinus TaxID=1475483 RepID=A0ABQ5VUU7_9RHOB|nr:DUF952 domain-containing protein [Amylibacter marinus]GLQ34952.1 hypothetical protein GCM10007939_12350 [Amylibacter marinus]
MGLIYKILRAPEWEALQSQGQSAGAPIDIVDGYIHFSTAETVAQTVAKYFEGMEGLMILALEDAPLGNALKYEVARGGALFPHLYGPLRMADVLWAKPLPLVEGTHHFPQGVL